MPIAGATLDGDQLWRLRLETAGLDEAELLDSLAEEQVEDLPQWTSLLADDASTVDVARPFLIVASPLIVEARNLLSSRIQVSDRIPEPAELVDELVRGGLHPKLDLLLQRTMLAELQEARTTGELDDTDQFSSFVDSFADVERRRRLFTDYPVLADQLLLAARLWTRHASELLERLVADLPLLTESGVAPPAPDPVTAISAHAGDSHRGSRSVAIVAFRSGRRIVYKPRPFGVDVHFQQFLGWVNARTDGMGLRITRCLDRGGYGWMEYVEPRPCVDAAELEMFYRRQGGLLAVLYLLHANDVHAENLIAVGDQPVLVDLETLFQPTLDFLRVGDETAAESAAADLVAGSVIHAGLLPSGAAGWSGERTGMSVHTGSTETPVRIPHIVDPGTATMRIRLETAVVPPAHNQPVGSAQPVRLRDHADHVVGGFTEVYRALMEHRAQLLAADGPLAAFAGDEVRVLVRDTSAYGMVFGMSLHPRLLRDRWDRERHFDLLWREVARRPGLAVVTESERRELWRGDIPVFTARVAERHVVDGTGATVADAAITPAWDVVMSTVDRLGADDLARQTWLIRACLLSNGVRWDQPVVLAREPIPPAEQPVEPDRLASVAHSVAERIAAVAVDVEDGCVWLGVHTGRTRNWRVGVLGPDFYSGGLGIALFLARYAEFSGSAEHRDRARRAVRSALEQVERGQLAHGGGELGLLGAGGAAYALAELGTLWADPELHAAGRRIAAGAASTVGNDEQFAVMDGSAGTVLGLAALHRASGAGELLDGIRAAADHLLAHQGAGTAFDAWLPRHLKDAGLADRPLAGYAHGASGVAGALAEAAVLLGDDRYLHAAVRATDYERSLFDEDRANWRDIRDLSVDDGLVVDRQGDWAATEGNTVAWCHGAAGIGMARLHLLRHHDTPKLRADLAVAVETTMRNGFGNGHSLCHGDFGSLELAIAAAVEHRDQALWTQVLQRATAVVDDIDRRGWQCGLYLDLESPGLFTGLAGIGHGALRVLTAFDTAPGSVLTCT